MICKSCGAENNPSAEFCSRCGNRLSEERAAFIPPAGSVRVDPLNPLKLPPTLPDLTTGAKIWLCLVICANVISIFIDNSSEYPLLSVISVILQIANIFGAVIMLLRRRSLGFYIIAASCLLCIIINLIIGNGLYSFMPIIGAVIIYSFINPRHAERARVKKANSKISGAGLAVAITGAVAEVVTVAVILSDMTRTGPSWDYNGYYTYQAPFSPHESLMIICAVLSGLVMLSGVVILFLKGHRK